MKISILSPNLSDNTLCRAWELAMALKKPYEVEIVGPIFGDNIWLPVASASSACDFEVKMVRGKTNGRFELRKMLKMISGEVVYASSPLMPSFGVALINKARTGIPVVLDIDDPLLSFMSQFYESSNWIKKIKHFGASMFDFNSYNYIYILNKLIRFADSITVSGKILQAPWY